MYQAQNNNWHYQMQQNNALTGQYSYPPAQFLQAHDPFYNQYKNDQFPKELEQKERIIQRQISMEKKQNDLIMSQLNRQAELFNLKNWVDIQTDELLRDLYSRGMKFWQINGTLFFHTSDGKTHEGDNTEIGKLISGKIGRKVVIIDDLQQVDRSAPATTHILSYQIQSVQDARFRPDIKGDFYVEHNVAYKNLFMPINIHLQKRLFDPLTIPIVSESITIAVLKSMVHNDPNQLNCVLQLLASFYQRLWKNGMALVLLGDKKVTENIFMDMLIKKIFAIQYCISIDDATLEEKTITEILENKLINHIGDLSSENAQSEKLQNLMHSMLIENFIESDKFSSEGNKCTPICGQTIITSNTPEPIIENCYSKCIIIEVRELKEILHELKIQDFMDLHQKISEDLYNFTDFLAKCELRDDLFKCESPIKIKTETEKIQEFIRAIKTKDMSLLKKIKYNNADLYKELEDDFVINNGVKQPKLFDYFSALYNKVDAFSDNGQFLKILREKDEFFKQTPKQIGSQKYYIITDLTHSSISVIL
jgi:hypothetical protein